MLIEFIYWLQKSFWVFLFNTWNGKKIRELIDSPSPPCVCKQIYKNYGSSDVQSFFPRVKSSISGVKGNALNILLAIVLLFEWMCFKIIFIRLWQNNFQDNSAALLSILLFLLKKKKRVGVGRTTNSGIFL